MDNWYKIDLHQHTLNEITHDGKKQQSQYTHEDFEQLLLEQKVNLKAVTNHNTLNFDPVGKLICERVIPFDSVPRELWLQFADKDSYFACEPEILEILKSSEGQDQVVIWLKKERAKKLLPANWNILADQEIIATLTKKLGEENVKLVEKNIEKMRRMN